MLLDLVYRRMMLHVLSSNFRAWSWTYPQLSSLHCTTELCVDFFGAGKPAAPADSCRVLDHLTTQCFPTCPRCKHHQWLSSRLWKNMFSSKHITCLAQSPSTRNSGSWESGARTNKAGPSYFCGLRERLLSIDPCGDKLTIINAPHSRGVTCSLNVKMVIACDKL